MEKHIGENNDEEDEGASFLLDQQESSSSCAVLGSCGFCLSQEQHTQGF